MSCEGEMFHKVIEYEFEVGTVKSNGTLVSSQFKSKEYNDTSSSAKLKSC